MTDQTTEPGTENVEVVRRRLRATIRRYRSQVGLSQKEAAQRLGFSESKLLRIEQGFLPIQVRDLRAMMQLYQETDAAVVETYVNQAIRAQQEKGYEAYSDIASLAYQELMGLEASAEVIYKYEASAVPGLLQTEEYARHLSQALGNSRERTERQVELRMLRQRKLGLDSRQHPELNFILGEAAIARKVGSDEVMNEQIDHLLRLSEDPEIRLTFLPFEAGPHRHMGGAFTIVQFTDPELTDLLYLEGPGGESVSRDEKVIIRDYAALFAELTELAKPFEPFADQVEAIRRARYLASGANS